MLVKKLSVILMLSLAFNCFGMNEKKKQLSKRCYEKPKFFLVRKFNSKKHLKSTVRSTKNAFKFLKTQMLRVEREGRASLLKSRGFCPYKGSSRYAGLSIPRRRRERRRNVGLRSKGSLKKILECSNLYSLPYSKNI